VRVIAGSAKGRRLGKVPDGTRPMLDRAKEGLFSSLAADDRLAGATVLDLFAGTGSLGIEALSRGAERATFVEQGREALRVIRENLEHTGLGDLAEVVQARVEDYLRRGAKPADLVFLDPPYAMTDEALSQVISLIDSGGWLRGEGWSVVLHRPTRDDIFVIPVDWRLAKTLQYGDTRLFIYRED
jgi:16S rRNA (guanine966-N2)-methyltransferase